MKSDEAILLCLSSSPSNIKVIESAARLARELGGSLTAFFVETPGFRRLSDETRARLREHMNLAEQLGARIVTSYGEDIAFQIAEYAALSGITKVVLGRSSARGRLMKRSMGLAGKLAVMAPDLELYIMPCASGEAYKNKKRFALDGAFSVANVLKMLFILAAATVVSSGFKMLGFSEPNMIMVYILGVLLTAVVTTGRMYSIISSLLSVLVFNFFFTVPKYTLLAYDADYPVTFLIMFLAAFITGTLTTQIKAQAKKSAKTAYRTKILLDTSQKLALAGGPEEIIEAAAGQLSKLLNKTVIFYEAEKGRLKQPSVFYPKGENSIQQEQDGRLDKFCRSFAQAVYNRERNMGAQAADCPDGCILLPVHSKGQCYGVTGIMCRKNELESFESNIISAILDECAMALEKESLNEAKKKAAMQIEQEKLRANLLRAISHDLRTPLTSISGNAGVLLSNAKALSEEKKMKLYQDTYDDAMWLIQLVENLLSVTRIEEGTMNIRMVPELVDEVIDEALRHLDRHSAAYHIHADTGDELMMARMDSRLIMQVIINIVNNAVKYSPAGSDIRLSAVKEKDEVVISISDNGPGISDADKLEIFDMFYTQDKAGSDSRRGLGLGLALCKSIILAHGGTIEVKDNKPCGSVFTFTLKAEHIPLS